MKKVYWDVYPAVTNCSYWSTTYIQTHLNSLFDFRQYLKIINNKDFEKLVKKDLRGKINWKKANQFFEEHTQFIDPLFFNENPEKASELWLSLLEIIAKASKNYGLMHKGTAYYHTGICSLFAQKHTEALQWLEYAYEEDLRLNEQGKLPKDYPAGWLLSLDSREKESVKGRDFEKTIELKRLIGLMLVEIKSKFGETFPISKFEKIAKDKILASNKRALRSSWASFLASFWEFERLKRFLRISPQKAEAQFEVNNFLVNLTLILETLIPYNTQNSDITLGGLYKRIIGPNYQFTFTNREKVFLSKDFPRTYQKINANLRLIESRENKLAVAFTLAYRIRNKTHHMFNEEFISLSMFYKMATRTYYTIFKVLADFYS